MSVTEHHESGAMPAYLFSHLRLQVLAHMRERGYSLLTEANNPEQDQMEVLDKQTEEIAASIIAKFDAALIACDLPEMERIAGMAASTPNHPLQRAILRHIEAA